MQKVPEKPRLLYLILCEAYTADATGKRSLIGTFDRIWARRLPYVFHRFNIVTGWEGLDGDYVMKIEIQDREGKQVFTSPPIGLRFKSPLYREDAIIEIVSLKFETAGIHQVKVSLGEDCILTYPVLVEEVPDNKAEEVKA